MAIPKEETLQNGFSLCRRSFTSPKIYLVRRSSVLFLGFLYWSGIILFSSDLFLFTFFRSLIENPSFPFLSFLPFPFFLPIFDWGIRLLAFVIRPPFRRFGSPLLRGEGWGFSSRAKVQGSLRLCLNMVFSPRVPDFDIWGKTNSCVRVSVSVKLPYYFHEACVTMMIWKQRAKLVMHTTMWVLKHPVHGIMILRLVIILLLFCFFFCLTEVTVWMIG